MAIEIVIPTFNSAATVGATLQSVFEQTRPVTSITVVDDGSSDDTEHVVRSFPNVKFLRNEKNIGAVGNWMRCMQIAVSDHVVLLHSDDIILPKWHERCCDLLLNAPHPEETFIVLGYADAAVTGEVMNVFQVTNKVGYFSPGTWLVKLWNARLLGAAASGATVYARRPFAELGGFSGVEYPLMPDIPLHFRMAQKYWIAYDPEPLAMMIQFPNSLSKANRPTLYAGNIKFINEVSGDLAQAVKKTREDVIMYGLFPYFVIDLCRPYWSRLKNIPDNLFTQPRAVCRAAGARRLANLVIKFAVRLAQLRYTTWKYRRKLTPIARRHADLLSTQRERLTQSPLPKPPREGVNDDSKFLAS